MPRSEPPPVFLDRRSYRQRRFMDALKMLPVLGLMLWMLPLFWPVESEGQGQPIKLSDAIIYVFSVWMLLILAAGLLWRALERWLSNEAGEPSDEAD